MDKFALGFLIWGCFAAKFPMVVIIGFVLCPVVFAYANVDRASVSRPVAWIAVNLAYWVSSGFLSGGIYLPDLLTLDYWTGEGRAFVSYIPLLFVLGWRSRPDIVVWFMNQLKLLAVLGFAFAAIWMVTKTPILSSPVTNTGELFYGLQTSHSGAGMFWATVCVMLLIYGFENRSRLTQFAGFLAVLPMLGTACREALFGLILALGLWMFRKKGKRKLWIGAGVGVAFSIIMIFAGQTILDRSLSVLNLGGASSVLPSLNSQTGSAQGASVKQGDPGLYNIRMRFLLWQDAVQKWTESPVCGIGFGRFNDTIKQYDGIEHLCRLATAGQRNYQVDIETGRSGEVLATGNAHNTYFQVLAELGLVGLVLLIGLLGCFWKRLSGTTKEANRLLASPERMNTGDYLFLKRSAALTMAIQGGFVCTAFGALFGDAWMAPSNFLILVPALSVAESARRIVFARSNLGAPAEPLQAA